jgi:hypothetical protein
MRANSRGTDHGMRDATKPSRTSERRRFVGVAFDTEEP